MPDQPAPGDLRVWHIPQVSGHAFFVKVSEDGQRVRENSHISSTKEKP